MTMTKSLYFIPVKLCFTPKFRQSYHYDLFSELCMLHITLRKYHFSSSDYIHFCYGFIVYIYFQQTQITQLVHLVTMAITCF